MFVHLHCYSYYSFLRGTAAPEALVEAAARLGMPAVALTDRDGLHGAVVFEQAARQAGIRPILGAVLPVAEQTAEAHLPAPEREFSILLLAAGAEGYRNLCRLVTRRAVDQRPLAWDRLEAHAGALLALYAPTPEPLPVQLRRLGHLKEIFADRLFCEVYRFRAGARSNLRWALELRRLLGVPLVATNRVHFLAPEDFHLHRVVSAIRTVRLLDQLPAGEVADPESWFKPAEEMCRVFADYPEALRATLEIAERAELRLPRGGLLLPEFAGPAGEPPEDCLRRLCWEGARQRYGTLRAEVVARLEHELSVIARLRLAPYFLMVWEIVQEARRRGIPAVGRGSAASSLVSYCLGISQVCPLRWGLYFERFLNEQRGDCPDIDLDVCGARRDELLEWVYARWGGDRVAMVGSVVTLQARLAVREVARALGVAPAEISHWTRRLPPRSVREMLRLLPLLPQCRDLPVREEPWRSVLALALRLDGVPRHTGVHPCGTVIAPVPLADRVPLERAPKGIVVTQYDMNGVEALGLVKLDLLGQRGLTTITLALDNIERATGRRIRLMSIPERDGPTCRILREGRTLGVFQIESPGMRTLLRLLRVQTLEQLCLALALIRPGAADYGAKQMYLRRLRGQEPARYPHPALEPILRETLGVCVYQEQVMQIAQAIGGLTLAEADLMRRAGAKFASERERQRLRARFLQAAARLGLQGEALEQTWQMVEKFAGFGFCKAHAATYAELAYRVAWLKAHYPAELLAAMCSSGAGFYHVSAYVEEARRWGIEILLPSVNHSRVEYTTEPDRSGRRALRIGLMQVAGLRRETAEQIVAERERRGPYASLADFLQRVAASREELETLIKCGAFDDVPPASRSRPARLWELGLLLARDDRMAAPGPGLFGGPAIEDLPVPLLPDYTQRQRLLWEQRLLGLAVSAHPLEGIPRNGEIWSTELPRSSGRMVALLGWLVAFRPVSTHTGRMMMFLTLEDQRGLYEAVLFPDVYDRYGSLIYQTRLLRVIGRAEPDGPVQAKRLEPLAPPPEDAGCS